MNDKLHLVFKNENYSINREMYLFAPNETINLQTGEKTENPEYYRSPEHNDGMFTISSNFKGLLVKCNPNKILKKEIGKAPLTFQELQNCIEKMNDYIIKEKLGNFDLRSGRVARFDNSFDIETPGTYDIYSPILMTLAPRIKKVRQSKRTVFENTTYAGNKSKVIAIYDKTKEQQLENNIIRLELRHLKVKREHPKLIFNTLTDDKYQMIRGTDKNLINDYVFGQEPAILKTEITNRVGAHFLELLKHTYKDSKDREKHLNRAQINNETIGYLLNELIFNEGIPMDKHLKVSRASSAYKRNNDYINLIAQIRLGDSVFVERYNELKELFRRVA